MPEGHVIHRLASKLNEHFAGREVEVSSPQGRFAQSAARIHARRFDHAEAWGKHLFLHFSAPQPESVVHIHLGLIGSLRFEPPEQRTGAIRLHIATDAVAANLRGPQWCRLMSEEEVLGVVDKLGADPLRKDAHWNAARARIQRSKRPIAALLMDQGYIAGVGNIYRAEVLFRHGIDPLTPGAQLSDEQLNALWHDLAELMADGVEKGWIDTVREEHTPEAMHRPAREDPHGGEVYVYRRAGQDCLVCGSAVASTQLAGRNLFWCPHCQPDRTSR